MATGGSGGSGGGDWRWRLRHGRGAARGDRADELVDVASGNLLVLQGCTEPLECSLIKVLKVVDVVVAELLDRAAARASSWSMSVMRARGCSAM